MHAMFVKRTRSTTPTMCCRLKRLLGVSGSYRALRGGVRLRRSCALHLEGKVSDVNPGANTRKTQGGRERSFQQLKLNASKVPRTVVRRASRALTARPSAFHSVFHHPY